MKFIVLAFFIGIISALALALRAMLWQRRPKDTLHALDEDPAANTPAHAMVRALSWRIGLSIMLFLSILFAWHMGWIAPTGTV